MQISETLIQDPGGCRNKATTGLGSPYTPPAYAPRQSLVTQMALCTISPGENLFVTY